MESTSAGVDAETGSDVPVDLDLQRRTGALLIARHVGELQADPRIFSSRIGAQWSSSSLSTSTSVYWYCVLESRAPTLMSCAACMYSLMPWIGCSARSRRLITWSTATSSAPRLQRDEHAPIVLGDGCAARADIGDRRDDRGVLSRHPASPADDCHHACGEMSCAPSRDAEDHARCPPAGRSPSGSRQTAQT